MLADVKLNAVLYGAAAACSALAALAGLQTYRLVAERADHAETRRTHAEQIARLERAAREAVEAARTEEQRRATALQGVIDETEYHLERARSDAAAATAAGQRLRHRIAELATACRRPAGDPAAADASSTADPAADLLADVQRRLDEAADGIARHADAAATAGLACERSYDALTRP